MNDITSNRSSGREPTTVSSAPAAPRLVSLDAFRGAIMLLMASSGFGVPQVAKQFPDSPVWRFLGYQFEHAAWVGCTLWDLIQPAFMFMVGVALVWSIENRRARGQSFTTMFGHALGRAVLLVLLAVFLTSAWSRQTEWVFTNVLAQIGLGYPLLFLLAFVKPRIQAMAAAVILCVYWVAFVVYPLPPQDFDWVGVGVPADWQHLTGLAAHWEKNANFASAFDLWFLNLFPREAPFTHSTGGYQTLNFVPSVATMIFGLLAGGWLRSERSPGGKVGRLLVAGLAGLLLGQVLAQAGLCPIVKRIWTPSWTIFSAGWAALLLAAMVAMVECRDWRRWAFPLVVAGLNPITLYCMWQLTGGFVRDSLKIHLGQGVFTILGEAYVPILERVSVLIIFWLILLWMYRRKIFLRL